MGADAAVSGTRPLLLGYARMHLLMSASELVRMKECLTAFAQAEGFALGTVFTEHAHTAPAGFHALIEAVKRYEARAVVVPSLRHLAVLGSPPTLERYVERCTGARVLVADCGS